MKYLRTTLTLLIAFAFVLSLGFAGAAYADGDHNGISEDECLNHGGELVQTQSHPPRTICVLPDDGGEVPVVETNVPGGTDGNTPTDDSPGGEDGTPPFRSLEDRHERTTDRVQAREELAAERQSRLQEHRAELVLRIGDRLAMILERIFHIMDNAILRLDEVAGRVANHIERFEELHPEADLTLAKERLTNAETKIEEAAASLADAETKIDELLATEIDQPFNTLMHEVRAILGETRDAIRAAHAALVDAVEALRASFGNQNNEDEENNNESDEIFHSPPEEQETDQESDDDSEGDES